MYGIFEMQDISNYMANYQTKYNFLDSRLHRVLYVLNAFTSKD